MTSKAAVPAKKEQDKTSASFDLALYKQGVVDGVEMKIKAFLERGELYLPENYSPENAIKQAWLILQRTYDNNKKPVLESCTRNSVANSLLDMIIQGLNPGKSQCDFIAYGNVLTCQRSYFGTMAVTKAVNPDVYDFNREVVYEGDKFKYKILDGKKTVTQHEQEIENIQPDKIKAAYCSVVDESGKALHTEIMTIEQIKQSWKQSKAKPFDDNNQLKPSSTHFKFPADMSLRTVINKACKIIINSSDDSTLLMQTIKQNEDIADRAAAEAEIESIANTGETLEIKTEQPPDDTTPPETETENPDDDTEKIPRHPAYDLCMDTRKCERVENLNDCPNANNDTMREKCTHWNSDKSDKKPAETQKTTKGSIQCPNMNGALVARAKCEICDSREGCPSHESIELRKPGF